MIFGVSVPLGIRLKNAQDRKNGAYGRYVLNLINAEKKRLKDLGIPNADEIAVKNVFGRLQSNNH